MGCVGLGRGLYIVLENWGLQVKKVNKPCFILLKVTAVVSRPTFHNRNTESALFIHTLGPCGGGATKTPPVRRSISAEAHYKQSYHSPGWQPDRIRISPRARGTTLDLLQASQKKIWHSAHLIKKPQQGLFRESTKYAPLCVGNLIAIQVLQLEKKEELSFGEDTNMFMC